jgi:hypothetical protein
MVFKSDWLEELEAMAFRANNLGVVPDLSGMDLSELWGVYCLLRRVLAEE